MADYPAHREGDVVLRDGSTIHIRPVRPEDREGLLSFYRGLSLESLHLRFFSGGPSFEGIASWAIDVDHHDRFGLVATLGEEGSIVAHASYVGTEPGVAEIAFAIADVLQGRGAGTILFGQLVQAAADNGIRTFTAEVLPQNHKMLRVFTDSGFPIAVDARPGSIHVESPTELSADARARFEQRERAAAAAALRAFLAPHSVAVIGASSRRGSIGGETFRNLLAAGFAGPIYPVNPKAEVVGSVPAYPSVTDIPGPVDLAVIIVPAVAVVDVAHECAIKGVRSLVVISAGFSETGEDGAARQRELLSVCRSAGMRLIGPNCMGILDTTTHLNATFAPTMPPPGRVGFLSQSGALGLAVIDHATSLGLGLSSFVSVGNKADISGNDLIAYWAEDPDTDLILLYLESFGNPRRFARLAQDVTRTKPIIAVKSGRSSAGARAASSHTGALLASSDITVDALFRQAGVIRTDTLSEMFDVAALLANQPAPRGMRVGILTNAGGPAILAADALESAGMEVPALPDDVRRALASFLPSEASTANPVDMIASASAEDYGQAIRVLGASEAIDALMVIFIPPLVTKAHDVARAISRASSDLREGVPLVTVFMSTHGVPEELRAGNVGIPSYAFPEEAARAITHAARYGAWAAQEQSPVPTFTDVHPDEAAAVLANALVDGPRWLGPDETARLLDAYGIPIAEMRAVSTPEEVGDAAAAMGGAVAVKGFGPALLHKSDQGAVALALETPGAARAAAEEMRARLREAGAEPEGFIVQRMADPGVEMIVGVAQDPVFGPVVACGAGGTVVELLHDVSVRITPLTERDAREMISSLRLAPLLHGFRGAPPADVDALRAILLRLGTLVETHHEVAELDLNPVIVGEGGATVVDARIRVEQPAPERPLGARADLMERR